LGRYYSRHDGNLYIYVTGRDELIDLKLFPPELNLFESESAWRINNRIAIVKEADEASLEQAEIILGMNGFGRRDYEEDLLENYYTSGDETLLLSIPAGEVEPEPVAEPKKTEIEDIIIPDITRPRPVEPPPIEIEIPAAQDAPAPEPVAVEARVPEPSGERQLVRYIMRYIRSKGFLYPARLVKNYYVCLKTKLFVILSGYSSMGKTALTRLMAEAVAEDVEEQYLRVAVQSNWPDEKGLIGFYHPSTDRYITTPFLDFLLKAIDNPDKPYFVCLDEMNLSRVEHYLSSLLSALESLDREIILHGLRGGAETEDGGYVPPKVKLPENLFITGTIDVDGSAHPLSPKLLDRTNSIEFFEVDLRDHPVAREYEERMTLDMDTLKSYRGELSRSAEQTVLEVLVEVNERTKENGAPVSYRMRREILDYVVNSMGVFSRNEEENIRTALDVQMKQRVLAKLAGTNSIRPLLKELRTYFNERGLRLSAEKTDRMLERLDRLGFTGYYV